MLGKRRSEIFPVLLVLLLIVAESPIHGFSFLRHADSATYWTRHERLMAPTAGVATALKLKISQNENEEYKQQHQEHQQPHDQLVVPTTAQKEILQESPPLLLSREEAMRRILRQNSSDDDEIEQQDRRNTNINIVTSILLIACGASFVELYATSLYTPPGFRRLPNIQYIAALGDPKASSGKTATAQEWGLWRQDPGPRGVFLRDYQQRLSDGIAPAGWKFDPNDWWLDENGIIMERPDFPLPAGRYLVSGGRLVTTGLTVRSDGSWELDDQHTLFEVTHLPCRSARYQPLQDTSASASSPLMANLANFPVRPGAKMPAVEGCSKQDYSVLLLVGNAI